MGNSQRVVVTGRVQQVGYRDWVVRKANALGVRGWVRNLSDGRVEMFAAGEPAALNAFIDATRSGPTLARVDDVVSFEVEDQVVRGFTKRFTA